MCEMTGLGELTSDGTDDDARRVCYKHTLTSNSVRSLSALGSERTQARTTQSLAYRVRRSRTAAKPLKIDTGQGQRRGKGTQRTHSGRSVKNRGDDRLFRQ